MKTSATYVIRLVPGSISQSPLFFLGIVTYGPAALCDQQLPSVDSWMPVCCMQSVDASCR